MIKVYQDKFGENGNCLSACVASIFELPLRDVPWFADPAGQKTDWYHTMREFCRLTFEREPIFYFLPQNRDGVRNMYPLDRFHLICGRSPRGYEHAVVGFNGKIVHDPHPDGGGLITITEYCAFYKDGEMHDDVYGTKVPCLVRPS